MSFSHKTSYINTLENLESQSYSSPVGQHGTFNISVKDGGCPENKISPITKEIWDHLIQCGITLTAEHLPNKLNVTAYRESRNNSDSSDWQLAPQLFQRICQLRGTQEIDLFAPRLSLQIKTYFSWKPDPLSQETDAFQQNWFHKSLYAFPPFCMIPKVFSKFFKEKLPMTILATPASPSQLWYPEAMRMFIQQPILLTWRRDLLKIPKGKIHPLVQNKTLKLVAWTVLGQDYKWKEFKGRLPTLLNQQDQVVTQIMNWPVVNELACVLTGKLIYFVVI